MRPLPAPALAALLLAPALAGCAAPAQPPLTARAGDFAVLDVATYAPGGAELARVEGVQGYLGAKVPPRLPPGWDAARVVALPPGLVRALEGARPGAAVETPLLPAADAWGERSEARTIAAPLRESLPREVEVLDGALDGGRVRWAGHAWDAEVLGRNGTLARVRLGQGPAPGAVLELPAYWNAHHQLWRSRLEGIEPAGLRVLHVPEPGREVAVGGVAHVIVADPERALADANHPLAGREAWMRATLRSLAFAGGEAFPEAPDAVLTDLQGRRFNVSELRGKPVLLDFFASWCITCRQQAPILARAQEAFGPELRVVSVTIDPTDTVPRIEGFRRDVAGLSEARWGRALPADWTFAFDPTGDAARGFAVTTIPREVLLDAQGRIRATSVGLHPWVELEGEVRAALGTD